MSGATAADFNKWEGIAKKCDITELNFIIKDCREAQSAMQGWNPEKENQRMTFSDELRRRFK